MLIIVCGLPGSGKTTLARALTRRFSAVHISSDIVRKRMFGMPKYSPEEKAAVYSEMERLARVALSSGKSAVVVDATFHKKEERGRFAELASRSGARAWVILCTLPEEEVRRRLSRRKEGGPSDADFSVYLKLKEAFEPIEGAHLRLDSALPMKERLRLVEGFVHG
jgi:predicted kinase